MSSDGPEAHPSSVPSQFFSPDLSIPEALRKIALITTSLPCKRQSHLQEEPVF